MNVVVKLTNSCNFACTYCSVGDPDDTKIMSMATLKKMINGLPELLEHLQDNKISFIWHGGEPLLMSREFYREAMDYVQQKLIGRDISFKMQTNGYLIDNEWIEFFKEYDINVGISLDGYQELHDASRCTKDDKPTFTVIMSKIQLLRDAGLEVGVLMVLNTAEAIDADKLFAFITENRLSCKIHSVYPCGRAEKRDDVATVYQSYVELMKVLYRKMMECDIEVTIDPITDMNEAILTDQCMGECSYAGTCGKDFLCLFEDGGVSFCGRHTNDFGLNYGNVHEKTVFDLYYSESANKIRNRQLVLRENVCASCQDYELCHGGCAFEAALANGNIDTAYPNCKEWRQLIDFVRGEGLGLLRNRLLKEKKQYQETVEMNKLLLEVLAESEL